MAHGTQVLKNLFSCCRVSWGLLLLGRHFVLKLINDFAVDKIYIEQTNRGINRHSQKELEFLHYGILKRIFDKSYPEKVNYVDTSAWRSLLKIRLSKEQKQHNKEVRSKKKRGKITTKHLVVDWVNLTFKKELILKDNNYNEVETYLQEPLEKETACIFSY